VISWRSGRALRLPSSVGFRGRSVCAGLVLCAAAGLPLLRAPALAQSGAASAEAGTKHPPAKGGSSPGGLFPGGNSKEPINIEADRLEYYDKDQKAIYIGNVVAVQGESTLKCSKLTILFDKQPAAGDGKASEPKPTANGIPAAPAAGSSSVKHMFADGPVSIVSKDQVGTGDRGEFDKVQNRVNLYGHVVLTQGVNVTKGDKLTYDLTSGVALVESGASTTRVSGYFVPGSNSDAEAKNAGAKPKAGRAPADASDKASVGSKGAKPKALKKPDGDV
jgi:lipopolysaccharide export system protein LptA